MNQKHWKVFSAKQTSPKNCTTYEEKPERLSFTELKAKYIILSIVDGLEKVNWCDENQILRPLQ